MKIALICNMNNNFFSLVRYFRDMGLDAELLIMKSEFEHFSPKADTFSKDYLSYTRFLSWGKHNFCDVPKIQINNDLMKYDYVFGCGSAPAYLKKISRILDVFAPYGSDLYEMPFWRFSNIENYYRPIQTAKRNYHQFQGIQESRYICLTGVLPEFENIAEKITVSDRIKKIFIPMVYTPQYNPTSISNYYNQSESFENFRKLRRDFELLIFHHTRHQWKHVPNRWTYKGNEKLIKGFAEFLNIEGTPNSCLVLFEYGTDVDSSKKLIKHLGIEKNVKWFPKMERKEIMIGISFADIGAVDFGVSWMTGGVLFEFLAMGIPTMQYREDEIHQKMFPELYPTINVNSAEDITKALVSYSNNPNYYIKLGEKGKQWHQEFIVEKSLRDYLMLINN